jgi:hypothetical protein
MLGIFNLSSTIAISAFYMHICRDITITEERWTPPISPNKRKQINSL